MSTRTPGVSLLDLLAVDFGQLRRNVDLETFPDGNNHLGEPGYRPGKPTWERIEKSTHAYQ